MPVCLCFLISDFFFFSRNVSLLIIYQKNSRIEEFIWSKSAKLGSTWTSIENTIKEKQNKLLRVFLGL